MKKLLTVFLTVSLLFSLFPATLSAGATEKISSELSEHLEGLPEGQRIPVSVTASFIITDEERKQISEDCAPLAGVDVDREEVFVHEKIPSINDEEAYDAYLKEYLAWQDFRKYRHQRLKALRQEKILTFLEEMEIDPQYMDEGHYHIESLCLPNKLMLTKQEIYAFAARENVSAIGVYVPPKKYNSKPEGINISDALSKQLQTMQDDDRTWMTVRLNQLGPVDHELMETLTLEMYGLNLSNGYRNDYPMYYQYARARLNRDYNDYRYLDRYDRLALCEEDRAYTQSAVWERFTAYLTKAKIYEIFENVSTFYVSEGEPPQGEPEVPDHFDTEPVIEGCTPYESAFNRYVNSLNPDAVEEEVDEKADYDAYEELYEHRDESGETDWVLIFAYTEYYPGMCHAVFGDLLLQYAPSYAVFIKGLGFAVYDVKEKQFYSLDQAWEMDYDDLHEVFEDKMLHQKPSQMSADVSLIGDMDGDMTLSIVDVTIIQRCHAGLSEWNDDLKGKNGILDMSYLQYGFDIRYRSDYDRNGVRDITDATALQRRLAKLKV